MHSKNRACWALVFLVLLAAPLHAQFLRAPVLSEVRIEQRLDEQIPLDAVFRDDTGKTVRLGDYFGKKPVVFALVYYECPMLCTLILNGLVDSLRAVPLAPGKDFDVVTVSINPRETPELAAQKKHAYLEKYGRADTAAGWHFLTGDNEAIHRVAGAAGFRYAFDDKTGQFVHASGIMIVTPEGRLARYFYGIQYSPRDVRLGLVEASANKIGSLVDQVLLICYHYDPVKGQYGLVVMNVLRAAGTATVLALGALVIVLFRRERRTRRALQA